LLTYEIVRYTKNIPSKKQKFVSGSEEHRQFILQRNVEAARGNKLYQLGKSYYAPGTREKGTIISILTQLEYVEWEGLKVKFLELYFPEAMETRLYHPSDLRKHK
jgi:hypothetical protein